MNGKCVRTAAAILGGMLATVAHAQHPEKACSQLVQSWKSFVVPIVLDAIPVHFETKIRNAAGQSCTATADVTYDLWSETVTIHSSGSSKGPLLPAEVTEALCPILFCLPKGDKDISMVKVHLQARPDFTARIARFRRRIGSTMGHMLVSTNTSEMEAAIVRSFLAMESEVSP